MPRVVGAFSRAGIEKDRAAVMLAPELEATESLAMAVMVTSKSVHIHTDLRTKDLNLELG
jgi:hypothetical protein